MSLLDKITQGFSQMSDLFSKQGADRSQDASAVNKSEKSNWFAGLFGNAGTTTPNFADAQNLNWLSSSFAANGSSAEAETSAQQRISERDSQPHNKVALEKQLVKNTHAANVNLNSAAAPDGYVQVPVTLPHDHPTPEQEAKAILTGLKYKDADIKAYNEHYKTDLVKDMSAGLGKNLNRNAGRRVYVPAEKKDVFVGYIAIDNKTHKHLKSFLDARRAGKELPPADNAKANQKPSNIKLDPVTVTIAAATGAGVGTVLIETLPGSVSSDIVPRAIEAGARVAPAAAELAAPVAMIAAEVLPTVLIADHLADKYKEAKDQFERGQAAQTYDAAREAAKATTATMTMEDADPLPLPIPDSKPKERPFAEPKAPGVPNIETGAQPKQPTDLVPTGNAKPEAKAQPQVKPETTVENLPQPYTPDAPRNNAPPQNAPKPPINPNTVPPIIIGAGALGKLALDKLSNAQKAELTKAGHTLPSLPPDSNRLPAGNPKVPSKKDKDPTNLRSINRENESAKTLAELGYKIEQLSDAAAGKYQGVKKPDFKIEGNIFDNYAPSASKSARGVWSEIRDKISDPKTGVKQADRFVINMDDSKLSLDEMTKQFKDFPLEDLKEIILVKNGEAVLFFPFEQ